MNNLPDLRRNSGRLLILCALIILLLGMTGLALAQGTTRVIFLHHSTGHNLIEEGGVREGLTALGYEFYDHGYNGDGLRLADGTWTGENFDVPGDNTDPDGFAAIFAQPLQDPPGNTFSHLMQYDVIAFKSCFPTSNIADDGQLAAYQSYYLSIRDTMDQHPEKIFIVLTPPPQVPADTDSSEAARARAFANWLGSDEFLAGHPNVFTFDFFDLLADGDNVLRREYRTGPHDAHPNQRANGDIGPIFVSFIDQAINSYEPGEPIAQPAPAEDAEVAAPEEAAPAAGAPASVAGIVDGFESTTEAWHANSSDPASVVECGGDTTWAYGGTASLRMHYTVAPDGWVDCGYYFDTLQDWSSGTGLSLWARTDNPGKWVTWMVFSGDLDSPTPFELSFQTTAQSEGDWVQFSFPWGEFTKAEWADAGGLSQVDPARITGYGFSVGEDETSNEGIIWVDDVGLIGGAAQQPAPAAGAEEAPAEEPPAAEAAPVETDPEPAGGGGICPIGAIALPLGAFCVALVGRRKGIPK